METQNHLAQLRSELIDTSHDIAAAEAEDRKYVGGLVKSLIAVRIQILRITKALIEQRIQVIESGAPVTIVAVATTPDETLAKQIAQELSKQSANLDQARAEAARYAGGLVAAMKASTVATEENSLAMLRQQFLIAKYGLAFPRLEGKTDAEQAAASAPSDSLAPPADRVAQQSDPLFQIVKVDTRVTEANRTWSKYAWKLTVQSLATSPLILEATIEFQDKDGFVIADQVEYNLILRAGEQSTFTGYKLIDSSVANNVATVSAKVKVP